MSRDDLARDEAERAFIRRSLDDLESERKAGDLTDDDFEHLKAKYDNRLSALDDQITSGRAGLTPRKPRNVLRTLVNVGIVALIAVLAGVLVARFAGQRLPSDTVTGGNIRDTNQVLVEARSALGADRPAALKRFRQVLETQPDNAEARTYAAWITRLDTKAAVDAGTMTVDAARPIREETDAEFERAVTSQPGFADPYCFQAVLRFRDLVDPIKARQSYVGCLGSNPNQMVSGLVGKVGPEIDIALASSLDPIVAGLAKARIARDGKSIKDAIVAYDAVTKLDPTNLESRTWSVWLLANGIVTAQRAQQISDELATTRLTVAEAEIDAVLLGAPNNADAACTKAVLAFNRDDLAAAMSPMAVCRAGLASPEIREVAVRLAGA